MATIFLLGIAKLAALAPTDHNALALKHAPPTPPTCQSSCAVAGCHWFEKGCPCSCNWACSKYDDCCADFNATCGAAPSPPGPHGGGPSGGPEQIHLSLTHDVSSIVISFASKFVKEGTVPTCAFRSAGGTIANVSGTTHTYHADGWRGLLHTVKLTGLAPATKYSYRCAVDGALSSEHEMTSAPPPGTLPVTIAVIGDLGAGCDGSECSNATVKRLQTDLASPSVGVASFGMLVHVGDIAYTQGVQTTWDAYMNQMEQIAASVPYQVCVGNHEHYHNFSGYLSRFAMAPTYPTPPTPPPLSRGPRPLPPSTANLFHSFDFGGVHFAAYSSEHELKPQMAWLAKDLAAVDRSVTPWVVVFAHRPIYCSTRDYYDCNIAGAQFFAPVLEPLLRLHKVDLALFGHLHNYERSWPVYNGTVTAKSYTSPNATVHAILGMGGDREGLTHSFEAHKPEWSAVRLAQLGYARLTFASAHEMTVDLVLSADGSVGDSFSISRSQSSDPW